jgi:hypothetical protein
MAIKSIVGATCVCLAVVSFNVSAVVLQGRLPATPGSTDYQAYYDTDADLTWLADANYAMTSGYDADGLMNWADANGWAASLNVGGVDGWRLASSLNADGSDPCYGYNCTGIEMGNLFYNVLGGSAGNDIASVHNANYGLFINVQSYYWTATEYLPGTDTPDNTEVLCFLMSDGDPCTTSKEGGIWAAWAVHSGDVSAVPAPTEALLIGSGLIGMIGVARRKVRA